jgi:hypothetical protein
MSRSRLYPIVIMLLLLAGFLSECGWAQNTDGLHQQTIPLPVQQIKELQQQTAELQEKVKALEAEKGQVAPCQTWLFRLPQLPIRSLTG